ncbi:MAG: tetratricopeptide repeat protein [Luteolibacter sp.]
MKFKILVSAAFIALVPYTVGAEPAHDRIAEIVSKLGSDSYNEREEATAELWQIGQPAAVELRKAAQSDDPEAALRAEELLVKVELRITPHTPPDILNRVLRYRDADIETKVDLLAELKTRRAYFQIIKLHAMEEDPETKIRLLPVIRGVAIAGARVSITEDDFSSAEELLRMSAMEPMDMMALACLYRNKGLLEDGMEMPSAPANVPTGLWEITLLRAKGDIEGAVKVASTVRRSQQLAGLKVLAGDPTLWLRQNGLGDPAMSALDSYVDLALKRWDGGRIADADLAPLKALMKSQDVDEREQAIVSLAALVRPDVAEQALVEDNSTYAFLYYLTSERVSEALTVIGIDPENPDYQKWVGERVSTLLAAEGDQVEMSLMELLLLAGFMELRGMDEVYMTSFAPSLEELAEAQQETFLNFLSVQFEGRLGAPSFAVEHAQKWAGDDEERWAEIFHRAFDAEESMKEWVRWITEMEPDIAPAEKMKAVMALFGIGTDNGEIVRYWIAKAWADVDARPENQREQFIRRILKLSLSKQDVVNSLKARDMLDPETREKTLWKNIDKYLTAADRWQDAAEILRNNMSAISTSAEVHARAAATLRKAGFEKEAAEHDAWVEKLALGQASVCNRIGDHYIYGEDPVRAMKWYRRAAFQADMSGTDFANSLGDYAQAMLEAGNWEIAASCFEALVQVQVTSFFSDQDLQTYTKARLSADIARALSILEEDRDRAIYMLGDLHKMFITDGVLADDFFPMLRKAGLEKELEDWFAKSWETLESVIEKYPESFNTRNTAGWLASRAGLKLDEAEKHMKAALEQNPDQAAYLDTMAEVQFARGNRKAALEWSTRAMGFYPLTEPPSDIMIRKQHERFKNAPFPLK